MLPVLSYMFNIVTLLVQKDEVSADILMNHADFKWWWSFHNLKASENISACEGMDGPVAIIMSEETPPRKLARVFSRALLKTHVLLTIPGITCRGLSG